MKRLLPFLVLFAVVAGLYLGGVLQPLENRLADARYRILERPASADVVLVTIDPPSLRTLDVWPWPRGYHATLIENLLDAGARRVGLDIDFSSRSDRDEDFELARALEAGGDRIVLPVFHQWETDGAVGRLTATRPLPEFSRGPELATIHIRPGSDGLVRRYPLHSTFRGETVRSFAAALADAPLGQGGEFSVDFGLAVDSIPRLSYVDVLTGSFDRSIVEGRIVIVGPTAVELGDQIAVPVVRAVPGPVLQALAVESVIQGRALETFGPVLPMVTTLVLLLVLGPWLHAGSWRSGAGAVVAVGIAAMGLALAVQWVWPRILETSPWLVAVVGAYGYGLVRRIDQQTLRLLAQKLHLRRTEDLMQLVVENSFDAIVMVSRDGSVEMVNRTAERIFDRPASDMIGCPVEDLIALPDHALDEEGAESVKRHGLGPYEVVARRGTKHVDLEMAVSNIKTEKGLTRVAFLRDITERTAQRRALQHQASHDSLTGLPNRVYLARRMRQALADARDDRTSVAFLLLDLDRFREINDTLGHHTGDLLLEKIAMRLEAPLGSGDTIARLGGDEFAVLLPNADLESAREMAWRLVQTLQNPFQVDGMSLPVDTSIGIAMYPDHGGNPDVLIQRGDVAMYAAKRERSKVVAYDPEHDYHSKRHLALTADLRNAIKNDQLTVHYQPKISADTGETVGAEVLVRWRHPEHGVIAPDEFIPIAEQSGLIAPLALWVLETSLDQCAEWRSRGVDIGVCVNLSARNLLENQLPSTLMRLLAEREVPPGYLSLEITESVIMEDPKKALEVLTDLSTLGIEISVDDFGTGYSSLGYLRKLPADELKIDKSFVMEMDRNPDDATIVRSTIDLAHNLGMRVVAEGVERPEVWAALKELGCDYGQGYLFSRPIPAEEFGRWHQEGGWPVAAVNA